MTFDVTHHMLKTQSFGYVCILLTATLVGIHLVVISREMTNMLKTQYAIDSPATRVAVGKSNMLWMF